MNDLLKDITLPFTLIALLLGAGLLYIGWNQTASSGELKGNSREAVAQVTKKRTHTSTRTSHRGFEEHGPTRYIIEYEFTHPDTGKVWPGETDMGQKAWDSMKEGLYYKIIFSEADPSLSSLFDGEEFKSGANLANYLGLTLVTLAAGGILLSFWLKHR